MQAEPLPALRDRLEPILERLAIGAGVETPPLNLTRDTRSPRVRLHHGQMVIEYPYQRATQQSDLEIEGWLAHPPIQTRITAVQNADLTIDPMDEARRLLSS